MRIEGVWYNVSQTSPDTAYKNGVPGKQVTPYFIFGMWALGANMISRVSEMEERLLLMIYWLGRKRDHGG